MPLFSAILNEIPGKAYVCLSEDVDAFPIEYTATSAIQGHWHTTDLEGQFILFPRLFQRFHGSLSLAHTLLA